MTPVLRATSREDIREGIDIIERQMDECREKISKAHKSLGLAGTFEESDRLTKRIQRWYTKIDELKGTLQWHVDILNKDSVNRATR